MTDTRAKMILGVDDDPAGLVMLNIALTTAGYNFVGAASGEECLRLVLNTEPRLILLDVQMPGGMDGYETCRALRKIPGLRETPIVFLTARKTRDDVLLGVNAGGDDFMVKPFDRTKLLRRVTRWLALAQMRSSANAG